MLVGQELAFLRVRMIVMVKDDLDTAWYGETTGAFDVIPIKGGARKFGASSILSDSAVFVDDTV